MVAKSFENYEVISDTYTKPGGKAYIKVRNPKTGTEREVRWYSNAEYKKLYPDAFVLEDTRVNHRKILGFGEKGYITIFKGINDINEDWFKRCSVARYHTWWGWYIVSDDAIPDHIPSGVEPITLYWDSVKADEVQLKSKSEVERVIAALINEEVSNSRPMGTVGEKMNIYVRVSGVTTRSTQYGKKDSYMMIDQEGNLYQWVTDANKLQMAEWYNLRVKVKEHTAVAGSDVTVVWYCTVED